MEKTDKLKPGQKLECINITADTYSEPPIPAKVYTVIEDFGDGWFRGYIDDSNKNNVYLIDDFIKLKPKKEVKGSRYNSGKLRWRNVPMFLLRPVVEVGAAAEKIEGNPTGKYETYNFLQGLSVADCMDCLKRHLDAVDDPSKSDIDPEDGKHHLAKVAWNALVALHYIQTRPDLDDRYKGPKND